MNNGYFAFFNMKRGCIDSTNRNPPEKLRAYLGSSYKEGYADLRGLDFDSWLTDHAE